MNDVAAKWLAQRLQKSRWAWVGLVVLAGLSFSISCRISSIPDLRPPDTAGRSVTGALLGESRLALSGHFYELADEYFHRGVEHFEETALETDPFQLILEQVSPHAHVHLGPNDIKEMMPWLDLAIRMDPHNVELYLVAAFWLSSEAKRSDLAQDVLRLAAWNNPFCYQAKLESGRIYLRQKRLKEAKKAFDAALAFWPGNVSPASTDARVDKAALLLYRALLHEVDGEKSEAIAAYTEILSMFPERKNLQARIVALERDRTPDVPPPLVWTARLKEEEKQRMPPCAAKHDHGEHDEHDD